MKDKIQTAFHEVKAEATLIEHTENYVLEHIAAMAPAKRMAYQPLLAAVICLVLMIAGGFWSIFTPTAEISIDINPSMILEVNRFDRVISLDSYNSDGENLIRSLNVKFLNYADAVDKILTSDKVSSLLSQDETMTIAVTGQNAQQSEKILSNLKSCVNAQDSVYCYYAESAEATQAHHMGLSHPRYQAYLTLQEQGQPVDAATLNSMSMKEIRDLLDNHHEDADCAPQESASGAQHGHEEPDHGGSDNQHHTGNGHQYDQDSTLETPSGNGNHHDSNGNQHHQNQHGKGHS